MKKKKGRSIYRCRVCKHEFTMKDTPKRAVLVKCPICKSEDVEIVKC